MRSGPCPKCGSKDVLPDVSVPDHLGSTITWQDLKVVVQQNPDAWLLKGEVRISLKAWVCGACGYTELYAQDPAALLAAYRYREEQS